MPSTPSGPSKRERGGGKQPCGDGGGSVVPLATVVAVAVKGRASLNVPDDVQDCVRRNGVLIGV